MNQENKGLTIIIYLIMIVIAIGGPIIAYNEQQLIRDEIHEYEDHEDEYEYEEDYEEDEDEYEEIPITPEPILPEENVLSLDQYLDENYYVVMEEDKEALINSTNLRNCMSDEIYGEMFKETISEDFKLIYTANVLVKHIGGKNPNLIVAGKLTIKQSTLIKYASKIFSHVELPSTFNTELHYFGTTNLSCTNGECTFTQDTFGVTGITPIDGYETKLTKVEQFIIAKKIYVDDEMINFNNETNIYTSNVKLYNNHNGKLLKTINNYEMDLSKEINVYDEFSPYYDTIDEYTYTFDDNNRLVKVSKTIIE